MSKAHLPPVPPAGRPKQGDDPAHRRGKGGDIPQDQGERVQEATDRNLRNQGQQGNIASNTKNQGYQQDR
jgi:hypothetical protein